MPFEAAGRRLPKRSVAMKASHDGGTISATEVASVVKFEGDAALEGQGHLEAAGRVDSLATVVSRIDALEQDAVAVQDALSTLTVDIAKARGDLRDGLKKAKRPERTAAAGLLLLILGTLSQWIGSLS